jgi:cephalosporin-C deacetylase-like acetyl esterase
MGSADGKDPHVSRRGFLRTGLVAGGLVSWAGGPLPLLRAQVAAGPRARLPVSGQLMPTTTIRDHLSREAGRITERALSDLPDAAAWRRLRPEKHRQFIEMLGLDAWWSPQREAPAVVVTGTVERDRYRILKLYYECLPRLYATANLYLPKTPAEKVPAVLYVCGHALNQKVRYGPQARKFAELGFACLLVETLQRGEVAGYHHGCYSEGWWHWYSRGYSVAGMETLMGVRGLDLLAARPEVDAARMGVTGISGGGVVSWWIGAVDERARVVAPVCGTATLQSHVYNRTVDGNCDCIWWNNTYLWDQADVGGLIAPRPLLIGAADRDEMFTIESVRQVGRQVGGLYERLGAAAQFRLVETPGRHSYHARSRTEIFSWFARHLQGREVAPADVGDIDERPESQESNETLRVYVNGAPPGNRVATIQDDFVTLAAPPALPDAGALGRERGRVVTELRQRTFRAFPAAPPPLDVTIEQEFDESGIGHRFAFTAEEGWRLRGELIRRATVPSPAPAVVWLHAPGEDRFNLRRAMNRFGAPWTGVCVQPRGTGETSWSEALNWHLRRAPAWTGRTLASMRVWDTLRALQAVRQLPEIHPEQVALAAQGEMAAVALYAALLDGGVRTLFLEGAPATQNAPGRGDGRGPAIEMLNCLRITDLPQVAGLLWPTELVFVGATPDSYQWTEDVYRRLGRPGRVSRVSDIAAWKPA